jgi:hypothetical protein
MPETAWHHEALARLKLHGAAFQVNEQRTLDDEEELVVLVVLMPVVLSFDHPCADDRIVDLAEGLIEPLIFAGIGKRLDVYDLQGSVQNVEARFIREGGGFGHIEAPERRIASYERWAQADFEARLGTHFDGSPRSCFISWF